MTQNDEIDLGGPKKLLSGVVQQHPALEVPLLDRCLTARKWGIITWDTPTEPCSNNVV